MKRWLGGCVTVVALGVAVAIPLQWSMPWSALAELAVVALLGLAFLGKVVGR